MTIMDQLTLRRDGTTPKDYAETCSGVASSGVAAVWRLDVPGRPALTIHDTRWENGERDLVLYQPAVVPEMPAPLSNLHNRLRAGIKPSRERAGKSWIIGWVAVPEDRPSVKKTFTTADLADECGLGDLRGLTSRPGVVLDLARAYADPPDIDLEDPQDTHAVQHALFFPEDDDETPVVFFLISRIAPTLRHIGWLPDTVRA